MARRRRDACHVCGDSLEGRRRDALTCSPGCRQKAGRARARGVSFGRVCARCGGSLEGRNITAITCSVTCRQRRHRAMTRASTWAELQAARWGLTDRDFWRTPPALFAALDREFGFTLDAAAAGTEDALCCRYLTPENDALLMCWAKAAQGGAVFVNPPYSRRGGHGHGSLAWVRAAVRARAAGSVVVLVLQGGDPTTEWARLLRSKAVQTRHPARRLAFIDPDTGRPRKGNRAPTMVSVLIPGLLGPDGKAEDIYDWTYDDG